MIESSGTRISSDGFIELEGLRSMQALPVTISMLEDNLVLSVGFLLKGGSYFNFECYYGAPDSRCIFNCTLSWC